MFVGVFMEFTAQDQTPREKVQKPKVRGIAGHIEQAERGAIRKSPQAHKHFSHFYPQQWLLYYTGLCYTSLGVGFGKFRSFGFGVSEFRTISDFGW